MYVPFVWIMWGSTGGMFKTSPSLSPLSWYSLAGQSEGLLLTSGIALFYAMGRKVLGHNTWFGKD